VAKLTHSVVSYPDRGPYGKSSFRGNTTGYLVRDLIETYNATAVLDPMAGSDTTGDVCRELDIPYFGYDLADGYDILRRRSQAAIRKDIREDVGDQGIDFTFLHPPYWNMIEYSSDPKDFSNGSYATYIRRMHDAVRFLSSVMSPSGIMAIQLADLRRHSRTWFLADDTSSNMFLHGTLMIKDFRYIKVQHKTTTGGVSDYPVKFAHEYVTILRKLRPPHAQ
jgi:hypothetical protein